VWVASVVCSVLAVLLLMGSFALRPGDWVSKMISIVIAVVIAVPIFVVTAHLSHRSDSALQARLGPNVWVHRCANPDAPEARLWVVVSDEAVTVIGRKDYVHSRWPLEAIVDVAVGPALVKFMRRTCLNLTFRGGGRASLALPSRSMLTYSRAVADEARAEILRRMATSRA
jgi:hypothetical protein